jgi:hypothetical protein
MSPVLNSVGSYERGATVLRSSKSASGSNQTGTLSERLLADASPVEQLQREPPGSQKQARGGHTIPAADNPDNQSAGQALDNAGLLSQLGGVFTGLTEVGIETIGGLVSVGTDVAKTGYDLALDPVADAAEWTVEKLTGQAVQRPEWAPVGERGLDRIKAGASMIGTIASNPGVIVDALVDPVKADWNHGRYGEAIGRGLGEAVNLLVGVKGAEKALKGARAIDTAGDATGAANTAARPGRDFLAGAENNVATASSVSEVSIWTEASIQNINKIGGKLNCANCAIVTDATLAGNPASALTSGLTKLSDLEDYFGGRFGAFESSSVVELRMLVAGADARGIVYAFRGSEDMGHFFNVINDAGTVRFIDGQLGGAAILSYFRGFSLIRTN